MNLPDLSAFQNKGCKDPLVEPQLFLVLMNLLLFLKHTELHGETPRPKRLLEQRMQGSACRTAAIFGIYYILMVLFMNLMWHRPKRGVPRPKRLSE